jgi:hypothetical protein
LGIETMMPNDWQTPVALAVAAFALVAIVRGAIVNRKKPGCGGGCGCPTDAFKAKLKRSQNRP